MMETPVRTHTHTHAYSHKDAVPTMWIIIHYGKPLTSRRNSLCILHRDITALATSFAMISSTCPCASTPAFKKYIGRKVARRTKSRKC